MTCELVSTKSPYSTFSGTIDSASATSVEATFTDLPAGEYKVYLNLKDKGFTKFDPVE